MSVCTDCGKDFKYPYLLLRHYQRKKPCVVTRQDSVPNLQSSVSNLQTTVPDLQETPSSSKYICKICKFTFKHRQSLYNHKKNVKCSPQENNDTEELKKKVQELESKLSNIMNITNNNTTNNNNKYFAPVYNITYIKETGVMICDNPEMEQNELLCIEGFQREAILSKKFMNVDYNKLNKVAYNVINDEEYDEFFKFLFRDDKNRRMHFMNLGKNVGATFCEAFKEGKIEKFEKEQLFNRVMGYLCGHLVLINQAFAPLSSMLFSKKSKRSFENALREPSEQFQLFIEDKN